MKTLTPSPSDITQAWYVVDATGQPLGRLSTKIATILRGKNKPYFATNLDTGDYVVVINADKVRLTGNKESQKEYIHHTGYLGHLRRKPFATVKEKNPTRILTEAVAGMIPRNKLKKFVMAKLHVYAGSDHPHAGQNPITLNV